MSEDNFKKGNVYVGNSRYVILLCKSKKFANFKKGKPYLATATLKIDDKYTNYYFKDKNTKYSYLLYRSHLNKMFTIVGITNRIKKLSE